MSICAGLAFMLAGPACAADRAPSAMAPLEQYLMPRDAEIALAKSAAPKSIANGAGVEVLGRKGFETALASANGFVCLVERSWSAPYDDPDFWNPKIRGPLCLNAQAVKSYLPQTLMRTQLALSGRSSTEISAAMDTAFARHDLPAPEHGALCYMLSKDGYLSRADGHWHPHLMFFAPATDPATWGAGLEGSPIFAARDAHMTVFMIPVRKWSDGTPDVPEMNHTH